MTRINVVPVEELCDQHLLAEHRELTRIPNGILSGKLKVHYDDRPSEYTLGKGHVKFFTNKLEWLWWRYYYLRVECVGRNFMVKDIWPVLANNYIFGITNTRNGNHQYIPSKKDEELNRARIKERWPKAARYYGLPMECKY